MEDRAIMNHKRYLSLLLAGLMLLALAGCGKKEEQAEEAAPGTPVQVQEVSMSAIGTENTVSGQVSSDNEQMVLIATSAKCTAVYFHAGDTVEAGDILCTLDLASTPLMGAMTLPLPSTCSRAVLSWSTPDLAFSMPASSWARAELRPATADS